MTSAIFVHNVLSISLYDICPAPLMQHPSVPWTRELQHASDKFSIVNKNILRLPNSSFVWAPNLTVCIFYR